MIDFILNPKYFPFRELTHIGEFTGGDGLESYMIINEDNSFSSLFSKTMEKLMEDVPKEQREAKMERMVKKLMEG